MSVLPWSPETAILLSLLVPAAAAIGIDLAGRWPNLRESVTLVAAVALFGVVATLLPPVLAGERPTLTLIEFVPGMPLMFRVEPLGMLFAAVASLLWPINSLYSIGYMRGNAEHGQTRFYICFAIALASTMGIAFAGNLLTLFIFYEALTLSTYPLVAHHEDDEARLGGRVYLGILLATSIGLLLPAMVWVWAVTGTLDFQPGGILAGHFDGPTVGLLLFLFMFGIGKAALMPIHRWLPAAMVAPTPVSALLHAVAVVKAGVFTVTKVIVYVFGLDFLQGQPSTDWLLYVAGFTVIVASVVAMRQDHLKRRLAYSTVSQLSYVTIAAAMLAPLTAVGAALHIAAHAFGKITLFFAAGSIHTAAHKDYVSQLNGIGRRMPWTMGAFAIGTLSMIGLPPAAGFVSKWYMLMGAWTLEQWVAVGVIFTSALLNAAYFLPIVYSAFFKAEDVPAHGEHADHGEAPWPVVAALTATAVLTVLLFLFPGVPIALAEQMVGVAP
ncbi:MAG: monovalent cation/H+ antiporter subunit D family protein [Halofilum sp. (in: g-proteobacteria)]|nr:monovalent cation/H+ antiporter subunit D family protein [Halofilum sp. (in: g-proteobacteria)]